MAKKISWIFITLALLLAFVSLILSIQKIIFRGCEGYLVELKLEKNEITTNIGEGKLIKGFLANKGHEDELSAYIKGPSWVIVRPEKIRVSGNDTKEIFVYISPNSKGDFVAKIVLESFCQKYEDNILIHSN